MSGEISIQALADESKDWENGPYTVSNITQLVKRGHLPRGRKEGATHYLPYVECKLILSNHKIGEHWIKNRPRLGKRKINQLERGQSFELIETLNGSTPDICWADVL